MVLTLAVGVAASVSTLTILHMMSNDPIPQKSDAPVRAADRQRHAGRLHAGEKPGDIQISYQDAMNILKSGQGVRRTALYGVPVRSSRRAARSRPSTWAAWRPRATSSPCSTCPSPAWPGLDRSRRGARRRRRGAEPSDGRETVWRRQPGRQAPEPDGLPVHRGRRDRKMEDAAARVPAAGRRLTPPARNSSFRWRPRSATRPSTTAA
jgi:hypothetical protein